MVCIIGGMQDQAPLSPEQIAAINQFRANEARKLRDQALSLAGKQRKKALTPREVATKLKAGTLTRREFLRTG